MSNVAKSIAIMAAVMAAASGSEDALGRLDGRRVITDFKFGPVGYGSGSKNRAPGHPRVAGSKLLKRFAKGSMAKPRGF